MERLGLGYEDLRARQPAASSTRSSSGYGQSGPYVKRPGQDLLIQALSGLMFLTGRRGRAADGARRRDHAISTPRSTS